MTYLTSSDLRWRSGSLTAAGAGALLSRESKVTGGTFDVFLSHSFRDALLILGLKRLLEANGLRVYIDWIIDPQLDRSKVDAGTAALLRHRMQNCASLIYATSKNATVSRWMPWELGYFDGQQGPDRVAICPVDTGAGRFAGEEYLGLYKTIEKVPVGGQMSTVAVRPSRGQFEPLGSFVGGRGSYRFFG